MTESANSATVRRATRADATALERLLPRLVESLDDRFNRAQLVEVSLEAIQLALREPVPDKLVVVAEQRNEVVGYALVQRRRDPFSGDWVAHILQLVAAVNGHGIGTLLVSEVELWSLCSGCVALTLNVLHGNAAATFYPKLGFEPVSTAYRRAVRTASNA